MPTKFSEDEECCGAAALGNAVISKTYHTMAIIAGCNAVLNFWDKLAGRHMAKDTLDIVKTMESFELSKSLLVRVQELASRDVHRQQPAAPLTEASPSSSASASSEPAPKKARVGSRMSEGRRAQGTNVKEERSVT